MEGEEIIKLNKKIRKYEGKKSFMDSLKKNLKYSKTYFEYGTKKYKRLSDKQYESALSILNEK